MITYNKLFKLLETSNIKRSFLLSMFSPSTMCKLSHNQNVSVSSINKLCFLLDCQPSDIMEFTTDYSSVCDCSIVNDLSKVCSNLYFPIDDK